MESKLTRIGFFGIGLEAYIREVEGGLAARSVMTTGWAAARRVFRPCFLEKHAMR